MLRVRVGFTGAPGSPWLATHYFIADTEDATAAAAANTAVGAFWESVDDIMDNSVSWATEAQVAHLDLDGTLTGSFGVTPVTSTGETSGDALPWTTQALVQLQTGVYVGGRQVRGRLFVPGLTEAASGDGVPSTATRNAINAAAATLAAVDPPRWCVWSRKNTSAAAVDTASTWAQWAVLRSRRD